MAYPVLGIPVPQFLDENGDPYNGGTLEIREPTNNAAKLTYPTAADADALTNPNSSDLTLNQRGATPVEVWGKDGEKYKVTLKDADGNTIFSSTNIAWNQGTVASSLVHIARTPAEEAAQITAYSALTLIGGIVNPQYDPGDIRRYGASTAVANNAPAIQAAYNQHSHGGPNPKGPEGKFDFSTPIYTYYDATNNPNWSNSDGTYDQGQVVFRGDGYMDYQAWVRGLVIGTQLNYTAATGIPWLCGNTLDSTHRSIRFENVTLTTSDTTHNNYVVSFKGTSQGSGLHQARVFQAGVGGGVLQQDCWAMLYYDARIRTSNAANTGIGFFAKNPANGAGNAPTMIGCSVAGFKYPGQIGEKNTGADSPNAALSFDTVRIQNTQFTGRGNNDAEDGLVIAEQCYSVILDTLYVENLTGSLLKVQSQVESLQIIGGFWRGDLCEAAPFIFGVEGGTDWEKRVRNVEIRGGWWTDLDDNLSFVERHVGAQTGPMKISGVTCVNNISATGTKFVEVFGDAKGLTLDGNTLSSNFGDVYTATSGVIDDYKNGSIGALGERMINGVWVNKTITYSANANADMAYSNITVDSSGGGAFTLDIQDGKYQGQQLIVFCNAYGGNVSVDFETDSTADSSIGTTGWRLTAAGQRLMAIWMGSEWRMVYASGGTTY